MDDIFSVIFFIWIAYAALESVIRKKKIPPPLQLPSERRAEDDEAADFEIPTLANDPNSTKVIEPSKSVAEMFQAEQPRQRQMQTLLQRHQSNIQTEQSQTNPTINVNLTQNDAMNAMILSEIFNKPKSLRRR